MSIIARPSGLIQSGNKDPRWSNVEGLWHFNGVSGSTVITDQVGKNNLLCNGSAAISNAQSKFYGTSGLATSAGTSNFNASTATTSNYAFGSGDFTIEFWYYPVSLVNCYLYDQRTANVSQAVPAIFTYASDGHCSYLVNNAEQIITGTPQFLTVSAWNHVAVGRTGTSTKLFINGSQGGSTWTDSTTYVNNSARPFVGHDGFAGTNQANGYFQDLRITKGFCRYTANFTIPNMPFPNS